jgi:simple sugar transport system permease protein
MEFKKLFKSIVTRPEFAALAIFIVISIVFYLVNDRFLSARNLRVLFTISPEIALIAMGVIILMISGEFDLSVGSVFALSGVIMVILINEGMNAWVSIVISLIICIFIGYVNSVITLNFGIPSFIATLGTMFMVRSIAVVVVKSQFPTFPAEELALPRALLSNPIEGTIFRMSFIWFILIFIILIIYLHRSNYGNWCYSTGANRDAAAAMGVNTKNVKIRNFILCAFLAGLSGIFMVLRTKAAFPSTGVGYELQAIAAAVIGGASLFGGIGTVFGACVGAFLLKFVDNGLVMARLDVNWFRFAVGTLLIIAVILNTHLRRVGKKMRE